MRMRARRPRRAGRREVPGVLGLAFPDLAGLFQPVAIVTERANVVAVAAPALAGSPRRLAHAAVVIVLARVDLDGATRGTAKCICHICLRGGEGAGPRGHASVEIRFA